MPHTAIIIAKKVIENQDTYAECIVSRAKLILEWEEDRIKLLKKLWTDYREVFKEISVAAYKQNDYMKRKKIVNDILYKHLPIGANPKEFINNFHTARSSIRGRSNMLLGFEILKASVLASDCEDVKAMHSYLSCVNARRKDDSLVEVGFLRWVTPSELSEILLLKSIKMSKTISDLQNEKIDRVKKRM